MGLTRLAIKLVVKIPKVDSFNTYLFVGPHADDIEIGAGATISKLVKMGKKIVFVICTDGRFGKENLKEDISSEELIEIRKKECLASASYLGVNDVRFLDLCDGNQYEIDELKYRLSKVINDVKPDIIFTPDPDVKSECHADHLNVGKVCKELALFASYPEIFEKYLHDEKSNQVDVQAIAFYMTASPNRYFKTTGHLKRQLNAIFDYHVSQYPKDSPASDALKTYLKLRSFEYGIKRLHISGEGFRILGKTHMHCLPEMGK